MTLARWFLQEDINFLVTNRIPRRYVTLFVGWLSRIQSPLLTRLAIAAWRRFDPGLSFAEAKRRDFASIRDCFIRELREGTRPIDDDPRTVVSPCDAIVGACGTLADGQALQVKGSPYHVADLVGDANLVARLAAGRYVTLRLRASMYHRFHAPCDGRLRSVRYISGDTWNVNPIALQRVERLFCRNERAVLALELSAPALQLAMVPVAAILVASIRLHCLPAPLTLRYRGANEIACDAQFAKGDELGYFEHGSTIVLLASAGFTLAPQLGAGATIRVGEPLLASPVPLGNVTGGHDERIDRSRG
jgi:phosphatidylserine decarboxylase